MITPSLLCACKQKFIVTSLIVYIKGLVFLLCLSPVNQGHRCKIDTDRALGSYVGHMLAHVGFTKVYKLTAINYLDVEQYRMDFV